MNPSVLSQEFAEQKRRESTPCLGENPRQLTHLTAASLSSDADFDPFVPSAASMPFGHPSTNR
jgi:hypothetical protein